MSDLEYQNEQVYFLTFCIEQYKHIKNIDGLTVKQMFDKIGLTDYLTKIMKSSIHKANSGFLMT